MVEIFRTNVDSKRESVYLIVEIQSKFPDLMVNFDLEDCDRILRVQGNKIPIDEIEQLLIFAGFECKLIAY